MQAEVNKCYRHRNGEIYEVLQIAENTDRNEQLVIYRSCDGKKKTVWARSREKFEDGRFKEELV